MAIPALSALSKWLFPPEAQVSLRTTAISDAFNSVQENATVIEIIKPAERGRVRFQATEWFAVCPYHVVLLPGTPVRVIGRSNITLIIEPLPLVAPRSLSLLNPA